MARYPSLYQINTRVWLRELSDVWEAWRRLPIFLMIFSIR